MNHRERELLKKAILKLAGKENKNGFFSANTLSDCEDEVIEKFRRDNPGKEIDTQVIEREARTLYEKGMGAELPNFYISDGHSMVRGPIFSPEEIKVLFPPPPLRCRRLSAKAFDDVIPVKDKNVFKKTKLLLEIEDIKVRVFYCAETKEVFYMDEKVLPIADLIAPDGELLGGSLGSLWVDDGEGFCFMTMGILGYGRQATALVNEELKGLLPEEKEEAEGVE